MNLTLSLCLRGVHPLFLTLITRRGSSIQRHQRSSLFSLFVYAYTMYSRTEGEFAGQTYLLSLVAAAYPGLLQMGVRMNMALTCI